VSWTMTLNTCSDCWQLKPVVRWYHCGTLVVNLWQTSTKHHHHHRRHHHHFY